MILKQKSPPLIWLIYTFISTFFSYFLFDWKITIGFFVAGVLMGGLCLAENFLKE